MHNAPIDIVEPIMESVLTRFAQFVAHVLLGLCALLPVGLFVLPGRLPVFSERAETWVLHPALRQVAHWIARYPAGALVLLCAVTLPAGAAWSNLARFLSHGCLRLKLLSQRYPYAAGAWRASDTRTTSARDAAKLSLFGIMRFPRSERTLLRERNLRGTFAASYAWLAMWLALALVFQILLPPHRVPGHPGWTLTLASALVGVGTGAYALRELNEFYRDLAASGSIAGSARDEFGEIAFAENYEALSDTFINIERAAGSLVRLIPKHTEIFELGIGTGYFAAQLISVGRRVSGIEPSSTMLELVERNHPTIEVAKASIEDYVFTRRHDAIVSHSSVFLFTRLWPMAGKIDEPGVALVFQAMLEDEDRVLKCLTKVLAALEPDGKLLVNVQTNPREFAEVGPMDSRYRFEMIRCEYLLESGRVEKTFRSTHRDIVRTMEERMICWPLAEFRRRVHAIGGSVTVSEDMEWVVVQPASRSEKPASSHSFH